MKIAIYTLGCKVNQYETQAMESCLRDRGHELVPFEKAADAYIINTFAVTAVSGHKSRQIIRRAQKQNPAAVVAVCGCYAQTDPEAVAALGVDLVGGSDRRMEFLADLERLMDKKIMSTTRKLDAGCTGSDPDFRGFEVGLAGFGGGLTDPEEKIAPLVTVGNIMSTRTFEELPAGGLSTRTRAMLKVEDGCVNFCSYCIIPYARGPVRSLPLDKAAAEAQRLMEEGYREIVVTGIEISSWGQDLKAHSKAGNKTEAEGRFFCLGEAEPLRTEGTAEGKTEGRFFCLGEAAQDNKNRPCCLAPSPCLADLVEAICAAAPRCRIRLGSLEPRTVTEDFCRRVSSLHNLCPHFHLSMQSGCDGTLKRMNRKYDTARYYESVELLRKYYVNPGITTDLIVGFPGESEEEFGETLAFIRKCGFSAMHIFPYSRRPGTPADKMPGQVSKAVKEDRARRAAELAGELEAAYLQSWVGKELTVLFEEPDPDHPGFWRGHAPNYTAVRAAGEDLHNMERAVRICDVDGEYLVGELT